VNETAHDRADRGARLVGAGIIVSRAVGFVRGAVIAMFVGSGAQADAYNAALRIPNVLRNLLGEGAISASFVPVYAAALERGDEKGARALANALLGVLLVGTSLLTIIGLLVAPWLTQIFVGGEGGFDADTAALTTRLMRVLFPMVGLMVLSGWCLGVQNANRRFFTAYASAAAWSIPQIVLLVIAGPGSDDLATLVWWLSWATLGGAVLQIATQMPQVLALVGRIAPTMRLDVPGLRDTLRNFVPVVTALGVFQVSGFIDLRIAAFLPEGAVANLGYASQLYLLPLSLFGVAGAAAALPELARQRARGDSASLRDGIARSWERVLFYTIPSAVAFLAIGDLIVGFAYRGPRFGDDEQRIVYFVLGGYAIGLVAYSLSRVLAATYQAVQDYRTPFRAASVSIIVSAAGALALSLPFRESGTAVAGIAAGGALGAYTNLLLLWRSLRGRVGDVQFTAAAHVARGALLASLAGAVAAAALRLLVQPFPVRVQAVLAMAAFGTTFLIVARMRGLSEADRLVARLRAVVGRVR
jgi:putative peptidoglycan lipid II flippase